VAVSTLPLLASTLRLLLAHTATSPRLVRTRVVVSRRLLRRTLLRHPVAMMAPGTISGELLYYLIPRRWVSN
jgi:hypothetical protein